MANTSAMCTSFKVDILSGGHNFNSTNVARSVNTIDTFKAALYVTTGSIGAGTTAYSATNEVSGTNYSAGGVAVTFGTAPTSSGTTAFVTPSASIVYTNVTLTTAFDEVLLYNTFNGNKAVSGHNIGAQSITAATLTLTMPANGAGTALLNIA